MFSRVARRGVYQQQKKLVPLLNFLIVCSLLARGFHLIGQLELRSCREELDVVRQIIW